MSTCCESTARVRLRRVGVGSACALLIACGSTDEATNGQDPLCAQLQRELPAAMNAVDSPGALVSVDQGQSQCRAAAGLAESDPGVGAEPTKAYHIGSSTKTFVAATVLALHREGLLSDDKPTVEDWLPGLVPNGDRITLAQLLTHTSGLANYTDFLVSSGAKFEQATTPEALIAPALAAPTPFAPGEGFRYCNTGYILLGLVIEAATGQTWGDAVRSRFLEPLGLRQTFIDASELPSSMSLMHSYATVAGQEVDWAQSAHPSWAGAAGSMVSTLDDMARWTRALYGGELFTGEYHQALTEPAVTISAEQKLYYAVGTVIHDTPVGRWLGHGGTYFGSKSTMGMVPERDVIVHSLVTHDQADRFVVGDVGWSAALGQGLGNLAPLVTN